VAPTPASSAPAPPPAASPRPAAATGAGSSINFAGLSGLKPLQWVAIAGLLLAVLATFLAWVSVSGFGESESASAWNSDLGGDLQIGHWLGAPDDVPVEALVIIAIAAAGIWLIAGTAVGMKVPDLRYVPVALGVALVLIGALNYLYIEDQLESVGVDEFPGVSAGPSTGVYLVIVGGLVTAVAGFLLEQERMRTAR
jgi:hypothetical protein